MDVVIHKSSIELGEESRSAKAAQDTREKSDRNAMTPRAARYDHIRISLSYTSAGTPLEHENTGAALASADRQAPVQPL